MKKLFGGLRLVYQESIECCLIHAKFAKTGKTELILEAPDGERQVFDLTIERSSYDLQRKP